MLIFALNKLLKASLFTIIIACFILSPFTSPTGKTNFVSQKVIFVTSNGWHSGISLLKTDIPPDLLPEVATFPFARFIDFGRGDKTIYPTNRLTIYNTLRAALVPTPAVIHVVGLQSEPWDAFPKAEVISLQIRNKNFIVSLISSMRPLNALEKNGLKPSKKAFTHPAYFIPVKVVFIYSIHATIGQPAHLKPAGLI